MTSTSSASTATLGLGLNAWVGLLILRRTCRTKVHETSRTFWPVRIFLFSANAKDTLPSAGSS